MSNMLKSAILGVGLLAGTALAAQAQSVSSVPPTTPPLASAPSQPYVSTQKISPEPGGSVNIRDEHYKPSANAPSGMADHPYSMSIDGKTSGPKPN